MDPKHKRIYTGRSGQLAVMAELLSRGCNVAIPEIDVGEDVFTFQDGQLPIDRIQVKTANAKRLRKGGRYSANINVPFAQLRALDSPPLYYVFPVRLEGIWTDFIVISRANLNALHENEAIGCENRKTKELQLHLAFGTNALQCSDYDMRSFRNAWEQLPVLKPA